MVDSLDRSSNLVQARDFIAVLSTSWPYHPVAIGLYAFLITFPTTASEFGRLSDPSIGVAFTTAMFSVGVVAAMLILVRLFVPERHRATRVRGIALLLTIGFARGAIVSIFADNLGGQRESFALSRSVFGALSLPIVLGIVALVVSRVLTSREIRDFVISETVAAEKERDRVLRSVRKAHQRFLDDVDKKLRPAVTSSIRAVTATVSGRAALADSLDQLAARVIRPLSHDLSAQGSAASPYRGSIARRVTMPQGGPRLSEQMSASYSGLGVFLGSGTVLIDILPFELAFLCSLVSGLCVFGLVHLIVAIVGNRRWSTSLAVASVASVHAVAWIPPHLINQALLFPDGFVFQPWLTSIVGTAALGLLFQGFILGSYSSREQLVALETAQVNTAIDLSEARRRAWLQQRHLTHSLHSSVQSRVNAQARLIRNGSGKISTAEKRQAVEVLESVLDTVTADTAPPIDVIRGIADVAEFWSGMCDISFDVGPGIEAELANDLDAAEALQTVVLEIISNAIRHGRATKITITARRNSPESILITAANNGTPFAINRTPGLGMALYDELTAHWEIGTDHDEPVTLSAVIAARDATSVSHTI